MRCASLRKCRPLCCAIPCPCPTPNGRARACTLRFWFGRQPISVTFSSGCVSNNTSTISSPILTSNGVATTTYKAGTYEQLHWHPIEALYYVISGHATVRNFEGKEFEVGPGSIIYAPAGIAGAHEWEVKESLELLDIRATNETNRKIQYTVDKKTKRSYIDLEDLAYRDAISFKSHY